MYVAAKPFPSSELNKLPKTMEDVVTPLSPVDPMSPHTYFASKEREAEEKTFREKLKSSIGPTETPDTPNSPILKRPKSPKSRNGIFVSAWLSNWGLSIDGILERNFLVHFVLDIVIVYPMGVSMEFLKQPLNRCRDACTDFNALITESTEHSTDEQVSIGDWLKLRYMVEDITGVKNMLAGYKATISIALAYANMYDISARFRTTLSLPQPGH
ncbi:hypothetical protein POJ06DRAFT_269856 [Lipomyces tetrasporus]|uniref:Azaphilone pigments biosynthesis cluster protein L N-terminal domain-containing protein n=1 Tax=Lipomyces tetrasporus TaxID=54092 RepID=A0AAD7QP41_9ASCO|nr:uncharacterized protein POJ06DRAFT_269856 [Lipomyces tetrasporus]KAJ8098776.1 hypothetical protein POJ06DRAFT_269856 [Lipomyces tetrasporus]